MIRPTLAFPKFTHLSAALIVTFGLSLIGSSHLDAQEEGWGHLTGRIIVDGEVQPPGEITLSTDDRQYCLDTGEAFKDRSLIVGPDNGLKDAYVMMYFSRRDKKRPEVHPSYEEAEAVALDNENCRFEPHTLFIRTGQTLRFENSDRIGHNCHVIAGQEENFTLGAGQSVEMTFENPSSFPGIVKCDIHPWMKAILLIREEPYAAITDEKGKFEIKNIPAGTWKFQFWHARPGYLRTLQKDGETFLGRRGEFEVTIPSGETLDLGELRIASEDLAE